MFWLQLNFLSADIFHDVSAAIICSTLIGLSSFQKSEQPFWAETVRSEINCDYGGEDARANWRLFSTPRTRGRGEKRPKTEHIIIITVVLMRKEDFSIVISNLLRFFLYHRRSNLRPLYIFWCCKRIKTDARSRDS